MSGSYDDPNGLIGLPTPYALRRYGPRKITAPVAVAAAVPQAPVAPYTEPAITIDPALYQTVPVDGGRVMTQPSEAAARDARAEVANILGRLGNDGSGMHGFAWAAQMRADREQGAYNDAVRQYDATRSADASQEAQRALVDAEQQRRNAIRAAGINNPMGLLAATQGTFASGLLDPQARKRLEQYQEAQINELNQRAAGHTMIRSGSGGAASKPGYVTPQQRLDAQTQNQYNTKLSQLDTAERKAESDYVKARQKVLADPMTQLRPGSADEQLKMLDQAHQFAKLQLQQQRGELAKRYGQDASEGVAMPEAAAPTAAPAAGAPAPTQAQPQAQPQAAPKPQGPGPADAPPIPVNKSQRVAGTWYKTANGKIVFWDGVGAVVPGGS